VRFVAVPVKSLSRAKSRLSPVLSPIERGALTLALLEDVLDASLAVPAWETWVISPDEAVLEIAAHRGALALTQERPGLAAAIRQVERDALERDADALAVLLGDTALVTSEALGEALRTLGRVVLAPSGEGGADDGTNFLLRRPPRAIPARFGRGSFRLHMQSAAAADVPAAVIRRPELNFDLDEPGDILTLLDAGRPGRTRDVCLELRLEDRLRGRAAER
jgi:2-phospho-L-lactate guanylyltransferase